MRKKDTRKTEVQQKPVKEIEHQTDHPVESEVSLQQAQFAPGENTYLTGGGEQDE
ncbi:hypothetical protein [Salinibacillus xinjiangensis]|uniref:Uncharacterized protein n=1 Tax=Salinibacillus xinjiangensis TaxID=1229268 RepID=A0A6G1X950_9BACI|nr:hypothetical protein [Salinibacillus xinjiangensis]MRG87467.1 hypothetical protein [Salinibacillus xinjiangensis]